MIKKKPIIQIAKVIMPLLLGMFFLYITYQATSFQERKNIFTYLVQTPKWVVFLSVLFGSFSHISRAIRWHYMLAPMGYKTKTINNFLSIMVAYLANLGIPRSGEILRASTITTYEKVPFALAMGNIVAERIVDLLLLGVLILAALFLNVQIISNILAENFGTWFESILIGSIVILLLYQLIRYLKKRIRSKKTNRIQVFYHQFIKGVQILLQMPKKLSYLLHSIFIWSMYFLMFYVVKYALQDTYDASLGVLLPAFIVGVLTVATTNGGLGVYPLAVGAYFVSSGIPQESGLAFGWIVWTIQTVLVVVIGGLSFGILPLINRYFISNSRP